MDEAKLARAMRRRGKETSEAERIENQRILDEYKNMGFPDTDIGKTDINWKPYSEEDANEPYQKGGRRRRKTRRQRKSRRQRKTRRQRKSRRTR